jgi:hypothetical protein
MCDIEAYSCILCQNGKLPWTPSTLSKISFQNNKIIDAEFKCETQTKKRKNMKLRGYNELEKILPHWFQEMHSLFIYFNAYFFICCIKAYT